MLGSALRKQLNEDERSALLYQIALIKNANLDLIKTVIGCIHSNEDDIILVLGALARNNNITIQEVVIDELLQRLNTVLYSDNNEAVTTLIYALGNSGSKLAIFPLLSTLQFDDIDIQISAIRSLASHLDQPVVQQAIMTLLPLTDEDKILEEILKILIDAFENNILTSPSEEVLNAIIKSAIQLENPNLYELVAKYFHQLKLDGIDIYLDSLKQQHNYGEVQRDRVSDLHKNDSRVKRGSDWDENDSDYDVVASYSQRKSDVIDYPLHKAYIYCKTFGEDKLNMKVGAGAFAGININSTGIRFKFYVKAIAKVYVFGLPINVLDMEASGSTLGNTLVYKFYLKQGNSVDKNEIRRIELGVDLKKDTTDIAESREIFYMRWPIFVYIASINVYIKGTVSSRMINRICANMSFVPLTARGIADEKLSFELSITGGTFVSLLVSYVPLKLPMIEVKVV